MISSPYRYPGGKSKLLPMLMDHISPLLDNEDSFCDAFIGGGSVLLTVAEKYPNIKLYANDKDYWISCFWDVVASEDKNQLSELLSMVNCQPTLDMFYNLRTDTSKDKLQCAFKALFFNRCTFSGILNSGPIGGKLQLSKYKIDCRYNVKSLQDKIIKANQLLAGRTVIENKDFSIYLPKINCPIYVDPPYFYKASGLYFKYMVNHEHTELFNILKSKSKWVLSYDDCSEIRDLYKDKTIIDLNARYCINGKKTQWNKKNELIILGSI